MVPNIRRQLRRFAPQFIEARDKSLNEADTVDRLRRFSEIVLGYDPSQDIGREAQMKHKFVDLCLKIDGTIQLLVEVKAGNVRLRDRHIDQAWMYASQNNYRWVVLTNGVEWRLYHLTFDEGIEYEPAFVALLETEKGIEVVDYCLWALQRFYERGEDRFLNLLASKVGLIHDVDDIRKSGAGAYYSKSNPLTLDARAKK